MKLIEPLAIAIESDDYIVVHAFCDGVPADYRFTCNRGGGITGVSRDDAFYFKTYDDPLAAFWLVKSTVDLVTAHDERASLVTGEAGQVRSQPVSIRLSANSTDSSEYVVTYASISDGRVEETFTVRGEAPIYTISHGSHQWTANMRPRMWEISAETSIRPILSAILSLHHARELK